MTSPSHLAESRERRWIIRVVIALIALVLFIVFLVENGRTVKITFFFWQVNTALAWALVVAGVLGVIVGFLVPRLRRVVRALTSD